MKNDTDTWHLLLLLQRSEKLQSTETINDLDDITSYI